MKKKVSFFNHLLNNSKINRRSIEDIVGFNNLKPLLNNHPYIPFTQMSLRPYYLNFLINEIQINQRINSLEFGSGISTILVGRFLKENNFNGKLFSIEHNREWYEYMNSEIKNENLTPHVNLLHCPLCKNKNEDFSKYWYNQEILKNKLKDLNKIDLVFVDGPPAAAKESMYSRQFALPFIYEKLNDNYCIMLDDAKREGELFAIKQWEDRFNIRFSIFSDSLAVAYKGNHFISTPIK